MTHLSGVPSDVSPLEHRDFPDCWAENSRGEGSPLGGAHMQSPAGCDSDAPSRDLLPEASIPPPREAIRREVLTTRSLMTGH